jgi:hypothetical protein
VEALQAVRSALYLSKSHKPDYHAWAMRFVAGKGTRCPTVKRLAAHRAAAPCGCRSSTAAQPYVVVRADMLPIACGMPSRPQMLEEDVDC